MRRRLSFGLVLLVLVPVPSNAATVTVAQAGDAAIYRDTQAGTWSLAAGGTTLTFGLDSSRDFEVVRLATASGTPWIAGGLSDSSVMVNGNALSFGRRSAGFALQTVTTFSSGSTLRLDAAFELASAGLLLTRHYSVTSG
jgi:hypothetical protein